MSALLSIEGLTVRYGGIEAVSGVSLQVNEGEIVALLGANGAGKSSTLLAIAGAITPFAGVIQLRGERIDQLPATSRVAKGVVLSPEGRHIFPYLSVAENLLTGSYLQSSKQSLLETRELVLELFPRLRDRLKQMGRTLSGGEQQMLAIARALMAKPSILLLDEPSLGLAPIISQAIFSTLAKLRDNGVSILLVEQNAHAALKLADRACILETGRLMKSGSSAELAGDEAVKAAYLGG